MQYGLANSGTSVRLIRASAPLRWIWALVVFAVCAAPANAEYVVLRSGQRLRVTSYERIDSIYVLHMAGGRLELPAAEVVAIEPEDAVGRAVEAMERTPFDTLITAAALRHGVDERLITSIIAAESNFNPRAISPKDARGLMQLMPATARRLGVTDIFDPEQNIDAGARYLRELLDRYDNDLPLVLAAYNAGPARVTQYRGIPPFRETRDYIARVTERLHTEAIPAFTSAAND